MKENSEKVLTGILLFALFIFFAVLSLLSDGAYGGADNYIHYRLSRYAFQYPHFFIDAWGKPMFTILSSPFSQFGFKGIKIFNVLVGILAATFTYLVAKKLNYSSAWLAIFFCCFAPVFALMMMTGMTEVLFSFILIFSIWLFLREKYTAAAIVISFLPFARAEGFFIVPFFLLALLTEKKYRSIPFLALGTVFFTTVGSFYYKDLFWVVNQNFHFGGSIYGSGSLFTFVDSYKEITGLLPAILLAIGILFLLYTAAVRKLKLDTINRLEWLLVFLPFMMFFSLHSFLWWKGLGGSLGLARYITAVIPLAALLALKGLNVVFIPVEKYKIPKVIFITIVLILVVTQPLRITRIPVPLSATDELVKETSEWLKNSEYYENKIYYYDPLFYVFLEISPYDTARIQELIPDRDNPGAGIPDGGIVLWDAHFSANEGRLPLHVMQESKTFRTLKVFQPAEKFQVLGGYNYEIHVFQKQKDDIQ